MPIRSALVLLAAVLAGCAATRPPVLPPPEPVDVFVPVAVPCPEPRVPERPSLPIFGLHAQSPPPLVFQAYVASVYVLIGYVEELEAALNAYQRTGQVKGRGPRQ